MNNLLIIRVSADFTFTRCFYQLFTECSKFMMSPVFLFAEQLFCLFAGVSVTLWIFLISLYSVKFYKGLFFSSFFWIVF